ncbi:hypothetical protein F4818DRAFT_238270 [Hypoxylon cercidicola]|nr:hypothetical protein F4818DRAFT_238270 [Hypoxylon cercidicola]
MLLFPEQPENYTWKLSREALINPIFRIWLAEIDGMREVYGLDQPLFTALLRKDEPMLKRVLRTPSTSSDSLISNGIPAIHIAVFWPKGLELLLRLRQDADINMSYDGKTPLDLAICISGQTCEQKHDILCHSCGCAESLKILLEYGCRLTRYTLWWRWNMYQRSLNVVRVLLNHIKSWREQLTEIARRELSEADCHNIGIRESSVLDHAAPKVIRKLEARGVCPSKELQLDLDDYRLSPQSDGSESSSLYHDLHDTSAMEIAFKLGFRDSDVFYQAETPVMRKFLRFRYYEWFLDHGVDITNLVPLRVESAPTVQIPDWTVAHHIMSQAGTYGDRINTYDRLLLKLGNLDLGDSCECACSELEGGCSPLKVFLIPQMRYLGPILDNLWHLIKDFDACGPMPPTAAVAVIRVCTFEVLGIRHTCCATGSCYNEDFSHIRDEDESLLVELEELMADFKDRFHFKEQSLSQFMKGYWKDRMEQNKQEKDARRLSQEEIDVAASLGIILREESPEKEQISEEYKREYTCVWDVVEDCIRKLDEIYM